MVSLSMSAGVCTYVCACLHFCFLLGTSAVMIIELARNHVSYLELSNWVHSG